MLNVKSVKGNGNSMASLSKVLLRNSWNYMPPILVSSSVKCIAVQMLVIAKLNKKKKILRGSVCDIIRSCKELPVQS